MRAADLEGGWPLQLDKINDVGEHLRMVHAAPIKSVSYIREADLEGGGAPAGERARECSADGAGLEASWRLAGGWRGAWCTRARRCAGALPAVRLHESARVHATLTLTLHTPGGDRGRLYTHTHHCSSTVSIACTHACGL